MRPMGKWGMALLDLGIVLSLLAIPPAWFLDPWKVDRGLFHFSIKWGLKPVIVPLALLIMRAFIAPGFRIDFAWPWARKLLLMILPMWGLFWMAEFGLGLSGFTAEIPPLVMRGEHGEAGASDMEYDQQLGWRYRPGGTFHGRPVNELGFLGGLIATQKTAGVLRVICMGDSCTAQGSPPYSGYLQEFLSAAQTGRWEVINAGVHGYSIYQGRELYRSRLRALNPDLVTIYFGWNDHWMASRTDDEKFRPRSARQLEWSNALRRKRLYAFLVTRMRPPEDEPGKGRRVPLRLYEDTLRGLVADIRAGGAEPVLLTAAHGPVIAPGIARRNNLSPDEAIRLHDDYVRSTRRIAAQMAVHLVDLAASLPSAETPPFSKDGIHFTQSGLGVVAEEIAIGLTKVSAGETWGNPDTRSGGNF